MDTPATPPTPKTARRSMGREPFVCLQAWPADCFVQCGDHGIVLQGRGALEAALTQPAAAAEVVATVLGQETKVQHYFTAFFEAFPNDPDTFIRGEGQTIAEAEAQAWAEYERVRACPQHDFERRGYTNGAGFCRNCGLFKSKVFPPTGEGTLHGA